MSAPLTSHLVHNGRNVVVQHEYLPASARTLFHHSDDGTQQGLGGNDMALALSDMGNVDFFISGRKGPQPNTYNCHVRVDVRQNTFVRTVGNVAGAAYSVRDFFVGSSAEAAGIPAPGNALGLSADGARTLPAPYADAEAFARMPPQPTLVGDFIRMFAYITDYLVGGVYAGIAQLTKKLRA